MDKKDIRKEVFRWGLQVGYRESVKRLVYWGAGTSTATKLLAGNYESEPGADLREKIKKAMEMKNENA